MQDLYFPDSIPLPCLSLKLLSRISNGNSNMEFTFYDWIHSEILDILQEKEAHWNNRRKLLL